ncbi:hypothetical protein PV325_008963 [Microctonus aethiopoides]|nr:hypothetical protein PV325_008963 [Microctonus aethiopoides]
MEQSDIVEHFHGVYLLLCDNPKYKGRTYIGYTVDPVRRLKRHNAGQQFGGAKKTSNKGPWSMVLIIHGFPNSRAALRFEWAWQHPNLSRHLRHVPKKKSRQSVFSYCLMVVSEMLQVTPWCRLPLVFRWLHQELAGDYASTINLPAHMSLKCGNVIVKKIGHGQKKNEKDKRKSNNEEDNGINYHNDLICDICYRKLDKTEKIMCSKENCKLIAHLICLANVFRIDKKIIPINGICPSCNTKVLWGDLIRKKLGCNIDI